MISEDEISAHCYARTLQRAQQIAASERNILTKQIRYTNTDATLSAFVASSNGWDDRYRTSVTFEESNDHISNHSCSCPAYYNYDGMCKHAAALMIAYNAAPQKFLGYQKVYTPTTSPGIDSLMKRIQQSAATDDTELVDIETTLTFSYGTWSASFRVIGSQGAYVVKNISEFMHRMRANEHFSYGKKLAFIHHPSALTKHAQEIVCFLDKAILVREDASDIFWRHRARTEVERSLEVSDYELIELFDILQDTAFTIKGDDYGTPASTLAYIVEEDPLITIDLKRTDKGGFALSQEHEIPFVAYGNRMYAWKGNDVVSRCSPEFSTIADFLRSLHEREDEYLFISSRDMPLFCATVLPLVEKHLQVRMPEEVNTYRPIPCTLEFYFDKTKRGVSCEVQAVYNQQRHQLFKGPDPIKDSTPTPEAIAPGPLRDEILENKAKTMVEQYFDLPNPFIEIADDEAIASLVFGGLIRFQALGTVFTTPAFDRLLSDKQVHISTGLSLAGNLINLSVTTDDLPSSELAALLSSYRKRKRYHRLKSGAFLDLEGYDMAQLDRLVADFGITAKQIASGLIELPAYQALYLDEQLQDVEKDEAFMRYVDNFNAVDEQAYIVPSSLEATLRPYQIAGFRWMSALCDTGFGGILADEMGLGKSVQLISLLLARQAEAREVGPSLIICPASLVYNWMAELERFAPQLTAHVVAGTKSERLQARTQPCDILITSYDLARIDAEDYEDRTFFCCVLDEAQYIKNHATKTARAIKHIQAHHRFALTGTPMENRLSELWSIFDFLLPGLMGTYMRFRERFELAILGGDEEAARRLQSLVSPFMLRRCKSEVLRDLPDKLESIVRVHMEGEQQRLYAASEQHLRDSLTMQKNERKSRDYNKQKVEILAELTKLRQLCCDPHLLFENYTGPSAKLEAIGELIDSAMDAGEKSLVFSQFTSFLARIAAQLDKRGIPYFRITGATPKLRRLELVNEFNGDMTPVFLVSLKAGGTGLNLTGASVVIHADPWWNAAAQNQATDRAHRIGQHSVVSVHKVIAAGTIEDRIVKLQEAKSDLANQIIGSGGISLASLTKEDLLDLLEG